jgi:hypothetical protein
LAGYSGPLGGVIRGWGEQYSRTVTTRVPDNLTQSTEATEL